MVSLFVGQLCIFLHVSLLFLVGLRVVNVPFGRLIECCTYDVNLRDLIFAPLAISLNLFLAGLRLCLKNRQVGEKWVSDDCSYLCKGL
ncbi:membrane protein [Bathymodiolus azoricus thioautotrophic gill symbiont]|uniref:Membrane protein n=1 Tax=Bathymodiolus azoricus thioautotrophic gill symbiont TaxID=235205 RepID=A0A1H6MA59_9GAMM|nr:membrane protein [Bathymodiolus azoricus thioautotrophic gill symbiont]